MPWHWRIAYSAHGAAQPSLAAVEAATDEDSSYDDVVADELRISGGALLFVDNGVVKLVIANGAYTSVVRIGRVDSPPAG